MGWFDNFVNSGEAFGQVSSWIERILMGRTKETNDITRPGENEGEPTTALPDPWDLKMAQTLKSYGSPGNPGTSKPSAVEDAIKKLSWDECWDLQAELRGAIFKLNNKGERVRAVYVLSLISTLVEERSEKA